MQRGITLIEHMILAAIVCIIAAIAIPAYGDYQAYLRLDEFASTNNFQVDKSKRLRWRVATLTDGRKVDCKEECKFVTTPP